jgi:hypothetical protein
MSMSTASQLKALARAGDIRARIIVIPEHEMRMMNLLLKVRDRTSVGVLPQDGRDLGRFLDRLDATREGAG